MPPLSLGSFILTRSPDSRNGKNDRKTETRKSPSERGRNYTPLGEVVHCALPGASCGQRMISVDFQSVPIITGEATLPLRWLTGQDEVSKTYSFPKSYVCYRKPRAFSTEQRERARQMMIANNKAKGN